MKAKQSIKVNPRRPLDNDNPNGYQESDRDYAENNMELVIQLLDAAVAAQAVINDLDGDEDRYSTSELAHYRAIEASKESVS